MDLKTHQDALLSPISAHLAKIQQGLSEAQECFKHLAEDGARRTGHERMSGVVGGGCTIGERERERERERELERLRADTAEGSAK